MKFQKIACLLLTGVLGLGLAGCSKKSDNTNQTGENGTSENGTNATAANVPDYANLNLSGPFDNKGLFLDIKASDYVTLPDGYDTISLPENATTVTSDSVDSAIQNVMSGYSQEIQEMVDPVADGDVVNIDYSGSVDGVKFTGGTAQGTNLTIGSKTFVDDFEQQLIGHKPGDTFTITVTFPDGYADSTDESGNKVVLAGKDAQFDVTINYISRTQTPDLTDDFVAQNLKSTYGVSTVDELRSYLYNHLLSNQKDTYVKDYITNNSTFKEEAPQAVNDFITNFLLYQYYSNAISSGYSDLESYLSLYGYTTDTFLADMKDNITNGVHYYLAMQAVAEKEHISVTKDDVASYFASAYGQNYSEFEKKYGYNYLAMLTMQNMVVVKLLGDNA